MACSLLGSHFSVLAHRKSALVISISSFCCPGTVETAAESSLQLSIWPVCRVIKINKTMKGETQLTSAFIFSLQSGYFGGSLMPSGHFLFVY